MPELEKNCSTCYAGNFKSWNTYVSIVTFLDFYSGADGMYWIDKIESILFVPENLTFSEYLECLNFLLWTFLPAKTKQVKESDLFWDKAPTRSGKFKHLKFSENVKFSETNSVDSILTDCSKMGPSGDFFQIPRKLRKKGREWERSIFQYLEPLNFDSPNSATVNISCSS